jgi:hypothetical protein
MSPRGVSRWVLAALASVAAISFVAGGAGEAWAQQAGEPGTEPGPQGYDPGGSPPPAWPGAQQLDAPYPAQAPEGGPPQAEGSDYASDDPNAGAPLIPPNVEGPAYPASDGSYCYVGPHPVDTRVVPGDSWDNTQGQHLRPYPPIDTRLFSFRDGCYYFTGDPRDFGYNGQTYAYYGAHPVQEGYGGGWCFMMGPHTHVWAPWSPYFTVVGSWNYWHGPYDPFFWTYWPYYSLYYRSYYPSYYGAGRFYRGGGWRVAPAIRPVQVQAWRGSRLRGAPVYRGAPAGAPMRGATQGFGAAPYRGAMVPGNRTVGPPAAGSPAFRGATPGFHPAQPAYSRPMAPGGPAYRPSAPPAFHGPAAGPSRPSYAPAPAPRSFSPPAGGFHGGGFHGGGGGGFRRR